jgi:GT2 family glycosyltransferase
MVPRREGLKYSQARSHARTEANRLYAPLEVGQTLFERFPIRVVNPAIEKMPGESSIRIAFKGGRGVERGSDRTGGRVHMPPGMDAKRLKLLVQIRLRCHTQSLLRGKLPRLQQEIGCLSLRQLSEPFQYLKGYCCVPPQVIRAWSVVRMPKLSVVAIPVRDEAERIGGCLAALARQSVPADHIVLLLNNCRDLTADVIRQLPKAHHRLHLIECSLDQYLASAGVARARAMKHATSLVGSLGVDDAVILTTDADAEVPENWVEANLRAIEQGADAVCGMAVIDPVEALLIPRHLHEDDAREVAYGRLLDEIASMIVPDPADPLPRHTEDSGASIAIRTSVLRRIGGVPCLHSSEDRAMIGRLRLIDARVRHDPKIRVVVSGRIEGRAPGGMADTMRRRIVKQDEFIDDRIEPAWAAFYRMRMKRRFSLLWHEPIDVQLYRLARLLAIAPNLVKEAVSTPYFGLAWSRIEQASSLLSQRRVRFVDLPREMAIARGIYSRLSTQYDTELTAA